MRKSAHVICCNTPSKRTSTFCARPFQSTVSDVNAENSNVEYANGPIGHKRCACIVYLTKISNFEH